MAKLTLFLTVTAALALSGAWVSMHGWWDRPHSFTAADLVQQQYRVYTERLKNYHQSLSSELAAHMPDLLPFVEPPEAPRHGYQVLPSIVRASIKSDDRGHIRSVGYSWPWTEKLIERQLMQLFHAQLALRRAEKLSAAAQRSTYHHLIRSLRELRREHQNIDAHIQHNRLWQAMIAQDRDFYDRQTALHNAVLERQAIRAKLAAVGSTSFVNGQKNAKKILAANRLDDPNYRLSVREMKLAVKIREAITPVSVPDFVSLARPAPRRWIVRVPFYTDIKDKNFVQFFRQAVESFWRVRDGDDEFAVELVVSFVSPDELYSGSHTPGHGARLVAREHLGLFPRDGAVLTTGAFVTHVYSHAILLGPHDVTSAVLAHEFGHILGFRDSYFRGYKDLRENGFFIMEIAAEPNDIMSSTSGEVLPRHFESILRSIAKRSPPEESKSRAVEENLPARL